MPKMTVLLLSVEPLVNISSDGSIPSTDAIDALDSLTSFWALVPYMCVRLSALPGVFLYASIMVSNTSGRIGAEAL